VGVRRSSVPRRSSSQSSLPSSPASETATRAPVPNLILDPIWSLRPWSTTLIIEGVSFEVPPLTAADWLSYFMLPEVDMDGFVMQFLPALEDEVNALHVGADKLYEAILSLFEQVAARRWWVAIRLIQAARQSWHILGPELAFKGIDASKVSLSLWLDSVLLLMMRFMEAKDTTMFTMKLEMPPPGAEAQAEEMEMTADAFLSFGK